MDDPSRTSQSEPIDKEHERTYRKFVKFARFVAFAMPFFVAFILHFTQ